MNTPGNLERLLNGEAMGTLVSDGDKNGRHGRKALIEAQLGALQPLVGNQPEQA
jgi:uridylate kinase